MSVTPRSVNHDRPFEECVNLPPSTPQGRDAGRAMNLWVRLIVAFATGLFRKRIALPHGGQRTGSARPPERPRPERSHEQRPPLDGHGPRMPRPDLQERPQGRRAAGRAAARDPVQPHQLQEAARGPSTATSCGSSIAYWERGTFVISQEAGPQRQGRGLLPRPGWAVLQAGAPVRRRRRDVPRHGRERGRGVVPLPRSGASWTSRGRACAPDGTGRHESLTPAPRSGLSGPRRGGERVQCAYECHHLREGRQARHGQGRRLWDLLGGGCRSCSATRARRSHWERSSTC